METTTLSDRSTPIRTCVGCRQPRTQLELHRCALAPDGSPLVSRTAPGRGAWICGTGCLDAARTARGFERAWRRPVPPHVLDELRALLSEHEL